MTRKFRNSSVLLATLLLLGACSSGGIGDILGGGGSSNASLVRGTVDYVDTSNRSIVLTNVSGYQSMLSNSGTGSGGTLRVYFDDRTSVQHEGQTFRPENLERGDEVDVRVMESGSQLVAESVTVVRDATPGYDNGGSGSGTGGYLSSLRGTVRYVDTSRRTIELDRGYGNTVIVEFDDRTPVAFNNRTYYPADLERGDEIDIRVTDLGNGRFRAQDINVVRSVSGSGTYGSSNMSVVRGTVRYVDTSRRTIELEQTSGVSGFNTGGGLITISYGSNATVEVSGRSAPISGLERGDVIEVEVDRTSTSNWFANRIILVRDVNSR